MSKLLEVALNKLSTKEVVQDVYGNPDDLLIEAGKYTLIESKINEKTTDNPSRHSGGSTGSSKPTSTPDRT